MLLQNISIINYKNIEEADLAFSQNINCFVGKNGQGKTNLLDAVYYMSFCKSATGGTTDSLNIRHDADFAMLQADFLDDNGTAGRVTCGMKRGQRKHLKINGKEYKRIAEHVGKIPLVMISPIDSLLITGGSEERRRFMNQVIAQYSPAYLAAAMHYDRMLKQRNAILRADEEPDWSIVEVLEDMMSKDAETIYAERKAFAETFVPIFQELYNALSADGKETVNISLKSHAERGPLKPLLKEGRQKERIVGYTLHGPHKDDLELFVNDFPIKREASQGQQKTYFLSMKLAQYLYLRDKGDKRQPILLLDDIFDKLDADRVAKIVDYVSGNNAFGQIFISDTNREHIDALLASSSKTDYKLFNVANGIITEQ
ncbi:MAG: DNA replication/repair protein RecF [Bacteroidaceae bacterium]|uniref:DNA replication and repair protein RecF n=1 Tax=Pseudoprevotella muciniphila TaxID=2133944 RepID=A0A5P8E571_9BACT|nr:DNA replication and repair protein RecF [Pseudoprevotella muciniphila]MBQ7056729.1 DNA replication/repair protein RecF [Bacteroidaceae bacterium]MBQ7664595.1 DNA replication/repair protein RecF [Bacteroidaceae bacterium]QFQ12077.1 DNA replication/repair protein RecF [Pseudoprevotella muciniphila]